MFEDTAITDETAKALAGAMNNLAYQLSMIDIISIEELTDALREYTEKV